MAQTPPPPAIVSVRGDPCPAIRVTRTNRLPLLDRANVGECVLETVACPVNPLIAGDYLAPSVGMPDIVDTDGAAIPRYPGFCEERFDEMTELGLYTRCTATTGFIRMIHEIQPAEHMCRLLHPSGCVVGLHRSDSNQCRVVKRRTWACPTDYIPRNEFGTCAHIGLGQPFSGGTHPACGSGAPDFVAQSCEDYVGNDYLRSPTSVRCADDFDTGSTASAMSAISATVYWCEFEADYLKVECHASPPAAGCGASTAHCLKRASQTGGCNAIAKTIRCRVLQSAFIAAATPPTVEQVRDQGCEPCVLLPFRAPPADCPDDVDTEPAPAVGSAWPKSANLVYAARRSLFIGRPACLPLYVSFASGREIDFSDSSDGTELGDCLEEQVCDGAPRGRLRWKSAHHADLAIVNSPVILRITDLTAGTQEVMYSKWHVGRFTGGPDPLRVFGDGSSDPSDSSDPFDDPVWRFWPPLDPGDSYGDVTSWVGAAGTGTCALIAGPFEPVFRVRVEELHPDIPAQHTEIEDLFGAESLTWWDDLSVDVDAQQNYIEARGLAYWPGLLTPAARADELDRRAALTTEVACNVGTSVWCRWVPTRPGYFKVTGASSWQTRQFDGHRSWRDESTRTDIQEFLRDNSDHEYVQGAQTSFSEAGVNAADFGMSGLPATAPTMLNPPMDPPNDEWLYTTAAGTQHRCPTLDIRVDCGEDGTAAVYGETEPVGIRVYEMRVATRLPNT